MCSAYIIQDLLEGTSTASALVPIGQFHKVKVIHNGSESVWQNYVIGRCVYLHFCIWLHLPSLFFWENLRLWLKFICVNLIGMVGGFFT